MTGAERRAKLRLMQQKTRALVVECELLQEEMNDSQLRLWNTKVVVPLRDILAFMFKLQKRAKELEKKPDAPFLLSRRMMKVAALSG